MEDIKNDNHLNDGEENLASVEENREQNNPDVTYVTDYSNGAVAKEYMRKLFPFTVPGKSSIYGAIGFILAAVFFALPGILSVLSHILPVTEFMNFVATRTLEFMRTDVIAMYLAVAWMLVGYVLDCIVNKKRLIRLDAYSGTRDFINKNKVSLMFALLLVIMTISSYFCSASRITAFENQTDGLFTWYKVAVAGICISLVKNKKHMRWLIVIFAVSAVLMATIAFKQYVMYYMQVDFKDLWTTDFSAIVPKPINLRQVRGIYANSNHCGYYLTMGTLAAAGLLVTADKPWKKILWALGFAVLINILILNDTLGSILAVSLIVLLIPIAFIKSDSKVYVRFIPIAIMILVMAFVTAFPNLPMGSNTLRNASAEIIRVLSNDEQPEDIAPVATPTLTTTPAVDSSESSLFSESSGEEASQKDNESSEASKSTKKKKKSNKVVSDSSEAASDSAVIRSSAMSSVAAEVVSAAPTPAPVAKPDESEMWWLKHQEVGTARLGLWQYAIHLMGDRPILGYGTNGAASLFNKAISGLKSPAARVHNEYLQIGLDFGIPAMILILVALFTVVGYFFSHMRAGKLANIQRIMFLMFAAYAVSAFTGICAYYTASFYYILLALLVSTFEGSIHEYPKLAPVADEGDATETVIAEEASPDDDNDLDATIKLD